MANAQLNGLGVLEACVKMPIRGAWWADVAIDASSGAGLAGPVALVIGGSLQLIGTANAGGVGASFGQVLLRMVGGAGGLGDVLEAKSYQSTTLSLPLSEAVTAGGETLSTLTDASFLATQVDVWNRTEDTLSATLDALIAEVPGSTWRVLPDGTIWVGTDTWPAVSLDYQVMRYDAHLGRVELGVDVPLLVPGWSLLDRAVVYVEHRLKSDHTRTLVTLL